MYCFFFILLAISVKFIFAQTTEERGLTHFDKLKVTQQITVYLTQGEVEQAKVVTWGIKPSEVITEVNGKTLEITLKRGIYKDVKIEVWLTYREMREIFTTASGTVVAQSLLTGDKIVLNAFTGSLIDANLQMITADIAIDKGGNINLKGTIGSYEAKVSSGAILSALELVADSVYVNASTKALVKINCKKLLDANVRTGSKLIITGKPESKKIKSGIAATILEQ